MLGVAIVAGELGLDVTIHRAVPLVGDVLPDNAAARAKLIHPQVVKKIYQLSDQGKIKLTEGQLSEAERQESLDQEIVTGKKYALVLLDWDKWNPEAQKKFGNPRHIVTVFGINNGEIEAIDPSINPDENPVTTNNQK